MGWRLRPENRCVRCFLRKILCICEMVPRLDLKTRVVLIMHHREILRTTNTGRLVPITLVNSDLRVRGRHHEKVCDDLYTAETQPLFLYPSADAAVLTPEYLARYTKPITLIVPDGNWRQASKVGRREGSLAHVPKVKLKPGKLSEYYLRREPNDEGLATFEAISRAMGVIEGPEVQVQLERAFQIMVHRCLWGRKKMAAGDCLGGIPPEAKN